MIIEPQSDEEYEAMYSKLMRLGQKEIAKALRYNNRIYVDMNNKSPTTAKAIMALMTDLY